VARELLTALTEAGAQGRKKSLGRFIRSAARAKAQALWDRSLRARKKASQIEIHMEFAQ
jgi:hypothetical protein